MEQLFVWWNAIYTVPLAVAALYLLLTTFLGVDHGHDHDLDLHHDVDLAVDAGAEVDTDTDLDTDEDVVADLDHPGDTPFLIDALLFLGGRQVSIMLVLQLLLLTWGVFGLLVNSWLEPLLQRPLLFIWPSMLLAGTGSITTTRLTAGLVGRIMPKEQSSALSREELVGLEGRSIFSVDDDSGAAHVVDRYGTLHQVACRTVSGQIARGRQVLLLEYQPANDSYLVEELPPDVEDQTDRTRMLGESATPGTTGVRR